MSFKLWVVNQYALPPDQAGITRNFSLAEAMLVHDVETLLIASPTSYLSRRRGPSSRATTALDRSRPVPLLWIPAPGYRGNGLARILNMVVFALLATVVPLLQLVRGRIPKPDAVLGSSPTLFAGLSAWTLATILRTPFVLELRDLHPISITALTNVSPRHPYIRLLAKIERFLYRRADLVVSPLQGAGDYVRRRIGSARPWLWIPNSVDIDAVPAARPRDRATTPFTFVYAGAHGVANDLSVLVDAAAELRDDPVHFVLFGDGVAKKDLRLQVERYGLRNVTFRDPVPKSEIYEHLAAADALIFLLRDNKLWDHGLSANKLYDYLASARPILMASNARHNPVLAARAGITVAPSSRDAIVEGVREMVAAPPLDRQQMGARGRAYVREHFHLPDLASTLAARLKVLQSPLS